jgi:hypothetical protein
LGEGEKSECASGEKGGGTGLGAVTIERCLLLLVRASPQFCDGLSVAAVKRRSPKTYVIAITNVELPAC